jgi:DNA-binding response OmpR family regulator
MDSPLILLAEEDPATRVFLADNLSADGYEVAQAHNRQHALALLANREPDLVLADVNGQTLGLLDAIRTGEGLGGRVDSDTPMIVLSSKADELTRVRVFEHDGDDVMTKPFSYPELRGRIRALLRRSHNQRHRQVVRIGTLRVDLGTREAHVASRAVPLTGKEFDLLAALSRQPTRVLTSEELLREVWGYPTDCRTRTVQSHAHRLRHKLNEAGAERPFVVAVWGVGYRLTDHAPDGVAG